jgi:hypothetical protein
MKTREEKHTRIVSKLNEKKEEKGDAPPLG